MKIIYFLLFAILFILAGCRNPTGQQNEGTSANPSVIPPITLPPATVTATLDQSASIASIDGVDYGTNFDVGYLEYIWFYSSITEIKEKVYMKFIIPTIPTGVTIESAYLNIWISTFDASCSTSITQVTGTWERTTLFATNEPTQGSNISSESSVVGWNSFNITPLVRNWVNGSAVNCGVTVFPSFVISSGSNITRFKDHDDAQYYPRISINYN